MFIPLAHLLSQRHVQAITGVSNAEQLEQLQLNQISAASPTTKVSATANVNNLGVSVGVGSIGQHIGNTGTCSDSSSEAYLPSQAGLFSAENSVQEQAPTTSTHNNAVAVANTKQSLSPGPRSGTGNASFTATATSTSVRGGDADNGRGDLSLRNKEQSMSQSHRSLTVFTSHCVEPLPHHRSQSRGKVQE